MVKESADILAGDFKENIKAQLEKLEHSLREGSVLENVRALDHAFHVWIGRGDLVSKSKSEEYQELRVCFNLFISKLLILLETSESHKILVSALRSLMNCVKLNSVQMMQIERKFAFDNDLFSKILKALVVRKSEDLSIIHSFAEFYLGKCDDLLYFCYKNIGKLCAEQDQKMRSENVFSLLMNMKDAFDDELELSYFISNESLDITATQDNHIKTFRKYYSDAWLSFMRHMPLNAAIYKQILTAMHEKLIPNMSEPRLLHGFLTASYNQGGSTGFLALHGLFILITQYNLDYPDFYQKLYQLLNEDVLHMKNRGQLLQLIDIFLKSTHLPATIVCAFLKKLARLSLKAPIGGILGMLPLMHNLFRRHKSAILLLHRELPVEDIDTAQDIDMMIFSDPFRIEEMDPVKSGATDSCLWELLALSNHYHPEVVEYIQKFKTPFEKKQILQDTTKYLNVNHSTCFNEEIESQRQPKLAYEKPNVEAGLLGENSMLSQCWKL